jgi:hypothetical protein
MREIEKSYSILSKDWLVLHSKQASYIRFAVLRVRVTKWVQLGLSYTIGFMDFGRTAKSATDS